MTEGKDDAPVVQADTPNADVSVNTEKTVVV
jgi:hypothetical protein